MREASRTTFDRHKALAAIVQVSIVLVWFVPVVAFAIRRWSTLVPGGNIAADVRGTWLLIGVSAGAFAMGAIGNGPIARNS